MMEPSARSARSSSKQRYWGPRCLLYGVDAALELRVISELAQHDSARPDMGQESLAQLESIAASVIANLTGLQLEKLEATTPGHFLVRIAGDCSEVKPRRSGAAPQDVPRDAVDEVEVSAAPPRHDPSQPARLPPTKR
jgi:hypothetical protein